jgi:hypothetical protein
VQITKNRHSTVFLYRPVAKLSKFAGVLGEDTGICNKHGGHEDTTLNEIERPAHRVVHLRNILCPNDHCVDKDFFLENGIIHHLSWRLSSRPFEIRKPAGHERTQVH